MRRILNFLICLDQILLSILTLGDSAPDETISSCLWRLEQQGKFFRFFRPLVDFVFWPFQKDHCRRAYESEMLRLQAPKPL